MKSDDWLYPAPMPEKSSWKMNGGKWKQIARNLLNYEGSFTPPSGRIRFKLEADSDSKSLNLNNFDSGIGWVKSFKSHYSREEATYGCREQIVKFPQE